MEKLGSKEAIIKILEKHPKTLNKSRLAKMLGITPQAVNAYLKNKSKMSKKVADKFEKLFDIKIEGVEYINVTLTPEDLK